MINCILGMDIGGTNFRVGLFTADEELIGFEMKSSKILIENSPIDVLYNEITGVLKKYKNQYNVLAVAIGFPSLVSKDKTTLYSTPNIPGLDGVNLKALLEEKLDLKVFIDRDVNFLLKNDIKNLNLDEDSTVLGFYIGTGIGNSIYINGEFYSGKNGAAGELGHIPLYGVKDICTCGLVGCSETKCSGRYLKNLAEQYDKGDDISQLFKKHGKEEVLIKFVKDIAIPIVTEINMLDPDVCIIAGGVLDMEDFPKELLEKEIISRVRKPYPYENLNLIFTNHTQKNGIYGAGYYAFDKLKNI